MVFNTGIRGSDQSKADLINMMPFNLWKKVLPKLELLTPQDGQSWMLEWAQEATDSTRDQEKLAIMRRLVFKQGQGSKLYDLNLKNKHSERG